MTQRMPRAARRALIAALIKEAGAVTTDEVATRLGISWMTVRRDFEALQRDGLADRTHGGAVLPSRDRARRRAAAADRGPAARRAGRGGADRRRRDRRPGRLAVRRRGRPGAARPPRHGDHQQPGGDGGDRPRRRGDAPDRPLRAPRPARRLHRRRPCSPPRASTSPTGCCSATDALTADGRLLDDDAAGAEVKRALVAQADQVVLLAAGAPGSRRRARSSPTPRDLACVLAAGAAPLHPLRRAGVPVRSV